MMTYSFHPPLHPYHRLSAPSPSWIREGGRKSELNGRAPRPQTTHTTAKHTILCNRGCTSRGRGWVGGCTLLALPEPLLAGFAVAGARSRPCFLWRCPPRLPPSITQRPTMSASLRPPPGPSGAQHKRPVVGQQPRQQASLWVTHNLAISFVWPADPCWKPACACPTRVGAPAGLSSIAPQGREPPPPWTCMPFR